MAARLGAHTRLPRRIPDPHGYKLIAAQVLLFAALFTAYALIARSWLVLPLGIPLAWCASMLLIGRACTRLVRPCRLLKLRPEALGAEGHLLVAVPALLSSVKRTLELCDGLETLGCLDDDETRPISSSATSAMAPMPRRQMTGRYSPPHAPAYAP